MADSDAPRQRYAQEEYDDAEYDDEEYDGEKSEDEEYEDNEYDTYQHPGDDMYDRQQQQQQHQPYYNATAPPPPHGQQAYCEPGFQGYAGAPPQRGYAQPEHNYCAGQHQDGEKVNAVNRTQPEGANAYDVVDVPETASPQIDEYHEGTEHQQTPKKPLPQTPHQRQIKRRRCGIGLAVGFGCLVVTALIVVAVVVILPDDEPYVVDLVEGGPLPAITSTIAPTTVDAAAAAAPSEATPPTLAPAPAQRLVCNGLESLCDVRVNNMLFGTVHNAASSRTDGFALPNHEGPLEGALQAGYRAINLDLGKCEGQFTLQAVHGKCSFGSRDGLDVLQKIVTFVKANPSDVILLPTQIENEAGGGSVALTEIAALLAAVPGLTELLYAHPGPSYPWPTLRTLIRANTRILFFHYNGNESCSTDAASVDCVAAGLHDWFDYAVETPFEFNTIAELEDTELSCALDRGAGGTRDFYGLNVFNRIPSCQDDQYALNNAAFLKAHLAACASKSAPLQPNLVVVDCWETGNVVQVVEEYNAAIVAPISTSAQIQMDVVGLTALMDGATQSNFTSVCNEFFEEELNATAFNVECNVQEQAIEISNIRRQLQGLIAESMLKLTVQVTGDSSIRNAFAKADLEAIIDTSGTTVFQKALASKDDYFLYVNRIVVREGNETASPTPLPTPRSQFTAINQPTGPPSTEGEMTVAPTRGPASIRGPSIGGPTSVPTSGSVSIPLEPTNAPTMEATGGAVIGPPPVTAPTNMDVNPETVAPTVESTGGAVVLAAEPPPTAPPTPPAARDTTGFWEAIAAVIGSQRLSNATEEMNAYEEALEWILTTDTMALTADSPALIQRFTAAYFYFATSASRAWRSCGKHGSSPKNNDDPITCVYNLIITVDPAVEYFEVPATRWLAPVDECTWIGIGCNDQGEVTAIELNGMNMTGRFPGGVQYFPMLERLLIPYGQLTGKFNAPPLAALKNLKHLDLQHNSFEGPFPVGLLSLTTNLQLVYLSDNRLTGQLPANIGDMKGLEMLRLDRNVFTGAIPSSLGALPSLVDVWLNQNILSSTLPSDLSGLTALADFRVRDNKLSGQIPETFYDMTGLLRADLSYNLLTGPISSKISQLSGLLYLYINDNQFTGNVPVELGSLLQLAGVHMSGNRITGSVPFEVCVLRSARFAELEADCLPLQNGLNEIECECCTVCCNMDDVCIYNDDG